MAQPSDTSAIQRVIRRARTRIRMQWALEGATSATAIAAAAALASVVAGRTQAVAPATGIYLLIVSGRVIIACAVIGASRKLDDEHVARRIDRASGLSDRLSTAIAFSRSLASGVRPEPKPEPDALAPAGGDDLTHAMMVAAIADGVRAVPRANLKAATPFAPPRDWKAANGFLAISALAAGLSLPTRDKTPRIVRANPDHALPGDQVTIEGTNLLEGVASPIAALPLAQTMGAPGATASRKPFVPSGASVYIGSNEKSRPEQIDDWTSTGILVTNPQDAPPGPLQLIVFVGATRIGMASFGVDSKAMRENAGALEPDEKAYVEAILGQLQDAAKLDIVKELDDFAIQIKDLLKKAENGDITKEQLLDALSKAEDALNKENAPKPEEVAKKLSDMGNEQQKQELAKKLDEVAKQMDKQDDKDKKQNDQQQQKLQDEIRRLEQQKDQAKNDQQKQEMERRREDKKRELQKLQKDQEQKEQSEQRRAVKRLQKDMEKAAENLQKKPGDKQEDQNGEEKDGEQQASQKLRDAARETGRDDKDPRKQATQKKMSSQMDDLREAMRRAKQRGNKGPQDPFNKQGKNQDFAQRSRGGKGQGQAWKPGQGERGLGQGKDRTGKDGQGDGTDPGGEKWGTEHDENLTGDPTAKSGDTKDQELQGTSGRKGGSTRETLLSAAQKGFASQGYQKVYADYQRIVEEVMRTEKLPSSYKYYVKRYFAMIHPSMTTEDANP